MEGASADPRGETVLVVEDNPDDTLFLREAARDVCPDITFSFVPDGSQALAYLNGEGAFGDRRAYPFPSLVLLDLHLPGMDGFQTLRRIRQLAHCSSLKVLAWSDGLDPAVATRAKQAGVECFIPKPFSYRQLLEEVHRICELARTVGAGSRA